MQDPDGLKTILKPWDAFMHDRSFRDVKGLMESEGFIVLMTALKGKGKLTIM